MEGLAIGEGRRNGSHRGREGPVGAARFVVSSPERSIPSSPERSGASGRAFGEGWDAGEEGAGYLVAVDEGAAKKTVERREETVGKKIGREICWEGKFVGPTNLSRLIGNLLGCIFF
jgi:hypothetical protein